MGGVVVVAASTVAAAALPPLRPLSLLWRLPALCSGPSLELAKPPAQPTWRLIVHLSAAVLKPSIRPLPHLRSLMGVGFRLQQLEAEEDHCRDLPDSIQTTLGRLPLHLGAGVRALVEVVGDELGLVGLSEMPRLWGPLAAT